ncbi:MAG: DUF3196 family protein [Erysipelotrichaceae bacterium]|nr:DUF3196 family protein [Erysipelotrichaceae bacterium]
MNYYEKTLEDIRRLLKDGKEDDALKLIENEFEAPYLPKDFKEELTSIYKEIKPAGASFSLKEEQIAEYLKGSREKQLIAVDQLNRMNLRDHISLCNEYLCSDGFINAKVLLVDSLIKQEIGDEMRMENGGIEYSFIPKYQLPVEESDGYQSGKKYLEDIFLKEPSKMKMAVDILYKELILSLPVNADKDEGITMAGNIAAYVNKAFGDAD